MAYDDHFDRRDRRHDFDDMLDAGDLPYRPRVAPGKVTLTSSLPPVAGPGGRPVQRAGAGAAIQFAGAGAAIQFATGGAARDPDQIQQLASSGLAGPAQALPHLDRIQQAFGGHDVTGVEAHVGGPAARASEQMGAVAYASGDAVAFRSSPDLHTAAHEAAHIVQQRAGVSLAGGVGQAGDPYERHADRVADAVVQGRSAEGLLDEYAGDGGGAPATQRKVVQLDEESLANQVEERDLGGPNVCTSLHQDEEALIAALVADAHTLIAGWAQQRQTGNLRFDTRPLDERIRRFEREFLALPSNTYGPGGSPISFANNEFARNELRRQLDAGSFRQYVREIRIFNPYGLFRYAEILGVDGERVQHDYNLLVTFGVSAGIGELLVGEAAIKAYTVRYRNDLGMTWDIQMGCVSVGGGGGAALSPVAVNIESSMGNELINAGSASRSRYLGPEHFSITALGYLNAEALMGGGYSVGGIAFTTGSETITFNTRGFILRAGTDVAGSVSATGGAGVCVGESSAAVLGMPPVEDRPEESLSDDWIPMIAAVVFFRTGETTLDAADQETIADIVERIVARERRSPGDLFGIVVQGAASQRWRGGTGESSREELNEELARQRAQGVRQALASGLLGVATEFTEGVLDEARLSQALTRAPEGQDPDDNRQTDRSVLITVHYRPCDPAGNVSSR